METIRERLLENFYKNRDSKALEKLALVEHLLLDLFYELPPVGSGEIILSGYIMGDGIGDYIHLQNACLALKEKFPTRKIFLIILSDVCHKGQLAPIDGIETHIEYAGNKTLFGPYISSKPLFSDQVIERLHTCELFISGPANIREPNFDSFRQKNKKKIIALTEYDYEVMGALVPFVFKLRAGLDPNAFGIWITKASHPPKKEPYYFSYMRQADNFLNYLQQLQDDIPVKYILRDSTPITTSHPLIKLPPLTQNEFNEIIENSSNPVGCTGDHSFAAAICLGKTPFYEIIGHKKELYQNYLNLLKETDNLSQVLQDEFDLSKKLQGAANWIQYKNLHPDYAVLEDSLKEEVLNHTLPLEKFKSSLLSFPA